MCIRDRLESIYLNYYMSNGSNFIDRLKDIVLTGLCAFYVDEGFLGYRGSGSSSGRLHVRGGILDLDESGRMRIPHHALLVHVTVYKLYA